MSLFTKMIVKFLNLFVGNALIDMYGKHGFLHEGKQVFHNLSERDMVSWTAMMNAHGSVNDWEMAIRCFEEMQREHVKPDGTTFKCLLNACSHAGLLDKAQTLFGNMTIKHGIFPHLEHLTCMVVIFGCAGYFDKAISVIKAEATCDYLAIWLALLGACRRWANVKLGKLSFDQAIQLGGGCALAYVLMSNIFVNAGVEDGCQCLKHHNYMN